MVLSNRLLNAYGLIYILYPFQPLPFQHLNYMGILSLLRRPSNNIHQYLIQDHSMVMFWLDLMLPHLVEWPERLDSIVAMAIPSAPSFLIKCCSKDLQVTWSQVKSLLFSSYHYYYYCFVQKWWTIYLSYFHLLYLHCLCRSLDNYFFAQHMQMASCYCYYC